VNLVPWRKPQEERSDPLVSLDQWASWLSSFSYNGVRYTMPGAKQEEIGASYAALARSAFKGNAVIFACMLVRMLVFSEARFQFRQRHSSPTTTPGLFGTQALAPLEQPWPGATTGDLLTKAMMYADIGGNAFFTNRYGGVRPLRPDWVTLIIGSMENPDAAAWDPESEVLGYAYKPGGPGSGRPLEVFDAAEVAHFAPIPDPEAQFRGMSWLTPVIREVMADKAATEHKLAFFENGATPNLAVKLDIADLNEMREWVEAFKSGHEGARNAYKTMFFGAGADLTPIGANMQQLEFKVTQGAGETRIAADAGVPPVIVGLSEGLQAATYSNYSQARRRFADGTMRPYWRNISGSLARIIDVPQGAELWYDTRDIAFLREDEKDGAAITSLKSVAIKTLVDAGYDPQSVVDAVDSGDLTRLQHSGLVSVQLQPPGTELKSGGAAATDGAKAALEQIDQIVSMSDA
jgi:hypothetical protein